MSERPTTEELLKAWDDADIARTHWTGCEWSHAHCAVRRLGDELADLRRKLEIAERAMQQAMERMKNAEDSATNVCYKVAFAWIASNLQDALGAMKGGA